MLPVTVGAKVSDGGKTFDIGDNMSASNAEY